MITVARVSGKRCHGFGHGISQTPLSVNDVIFAKRLTDITPYTDYIEKLTAIFAPDELDDIDTLPEINYPAYSSTNFLSDVYMTRHDYDTLVDVLKMKKNYYFTRCTWSW